MAGRHHTALGYADEVDIENFLLIDIDNTFSAQVEDWIAAAEDVVNNYTGYTTASGIYAEEFIDEISTRSSVDALGNLKVFPRKAPLISVSSLGFTRGTSNTSVSLLSGTTPRYQIPESGQYLYYPGSEFTMTGNQSFLGGFREARYGAYFTKMSYVAGYRTTPAAIRLATVNLVADTIQKHKNKDGLEQLTQGRVTQRWRQRRGGTSDFYQDAMNLLKPYRMASAWIL